MHSRRVAAVVFVAIAVASWMGCAANGTSDDGTGTGSGTSGGSSGSSGKTPPPPPEPPPSNPDFDAAFPEDSGGDPTPPQGDQCVDNNDPGGTESSAHALANIDDCDSSGSTITGTMNGAVDVDMYKFQGTDTFGCEVNPTASSSTTGLELCVFVACMSGSIDFKGCSGGVQKTSDIGDPGCCVATPGTTTLDYNCVGTTSESANVFIRVKQTGTTCLPYSVAYHF